MHEEIYVKVNPKDITVVNRIMEGYEYLGMVSTLDSKQGILVIRTTPDFYDEVLDIIHHLSFEIIILPQV